jgi:hypothetical protein
MAPFDCFIGKPSVADFAQQMIQAFHEAGDKTDLRFDASNKRIVRDDPEYPWVDRRRFDGFLRQDGRWV